MPARRSIPCRNAAACSAGKASSSRNAVMNCAHTKNGSRNHRHPGRAKLDDRRDEVDRAEQRRKDEAQHSDEPPGLAVGAKSASGG